MEKALREPAYNALFRSFTRMTALGISLIAIGAALVCAGLVLSLRVPQTPVAPDGPDEFRTILDALDDEDRRAPEG
jgi:hypothetical protein